MRAPLLMALFAAAACSSREAAAQDARTSVPSVLTAAGSGSASTAVVATPPTVRQTYASTAKYVVLVICKRADGMSTGSGFVHKSGMVVTAAHVVDGCKPKDITMDVNGWSTATSAPAYKNIGVADIIAVDELADLALLRPATKLDAGLPIVDATKANPDIGDTVVFIGYPSGYGGAVPMLGVGYLAAVGPYWSQKAQKNLPRGFVNGAFNHGNSGGPVIDIGTQTVLGVVEAKVVPLSSDVDTILQALKTQQSGVMYSATINGKVINFSEAQVVERVLEQYAFQLQLVVGVMILPGDVRAFLSANKITP